MLKTWKIEDANGNTISFVAPSKSAAIGQYKQIFPGGRVKLAADMGEAKTQRRMKIELPGVLDQNPFKPVDPVIRKDRGIGPNDPCKCGSGKKYKRCCMRSAARSVKAQ